MAHTPDNGRLGPMTREALEHIMAATEPEEGIASERAEAVLGDEGFSDEDAAWAIDRLVNRGYCYVVDDELFVTDREVLD